MRQGGGGTSGIQRRAGVEGHHVCRSFVAAVQRGPHQRQAGGWRFGPEPFHAALRQAEVRWRDFVLLQTAIRQLHHLRGAVDGQFVQAPAVYHQHVARAEGLADFRHWPLPLRGEHADHLAARAGGIGERPQQVEHRADAELPPYRAGMAHGRMMIRREQEADAHFGDAAPNLLGFQTQPGAGGFQHICAAAAAGHGAVAVLRHLGAGGSGHEGGRGGDVEPLGRASAASAAGIHQLRRVDSHLRGDRTHGLCRAGDLDAGFALGLQRRQHRGDLRRGEFAGHDAAEHALCFGLREVAPRGNSRESGGYVHAASQLASRKLASSRLPTGVLMDSGWNCTPCTGCSRCLMAMISSGVPSSNAVHAVTSRQSGKSATISEW